MWLKLSNGREELVLNEDHVKRLLGEGAVEIDDPRAVPEEQPESELIDGSQGEHVDADSTSEDDDQRSDESAVHRPKRAGSARRKS